MIKWINLLGICLDIAGAIVMFQNTPHPSKKPKIYSGLEIVAESVRWQQIGENKEVKEIKMTRLGIIFLVAGFVLQFLSAILQIE